MALMVIEEGRTRVAAYQPDGGALTPLSTEGYECCPEWSPDGSELLFQSRRTGLGDIWAVSADGGAPRQLIRDIRNDWGPRYSRDGRWIVFHSERGGQDDVWLMPAGGGDGEARRVSNE